MNQKIKVTGGVITLTDKHYKAAGGEASIYVNGGMAYKLYHDPDKKQLPVNKMKELIAIGDTQVIVPQELIFDPSSGKPLGYTTKFVTNSDDSVEPLVKLFTRTFKDAKGITYQMVNNLIAAIQKTTSNVHAAKCLIVDLNELNILIDIQSSGVIPWFIDTDSYSTPSYKATAIMDSIRDRKATIYDKNGTMHYNPTIESDWFSWSVLTFWAYSNIHPYRGAHNNYKPKDKQKQMDDGISVFHTGVRVPPSVNDFKVIPPRHLDWYKQVFLKGERGIPPVADSSVPVLVPTQVITIQGTDKISVTDIASYGDDILAITTIMGAYYVATKKHIYLNQKEIADHNAKKILLCSANDGTLIVAQKHLSGEIDFRDITKADLLGISSSKDMFTRNNAIYTMSHGKLVENTFVTIGSKMVRKVVEVANISTASSTMYDGCVLQDLLGKVYITLPYKQGSCFTKPIPQLNGYRVVGAKAEKNIVIVLGEQKGQYDRFIIIYDKHFSQCDVRKIEDVTYDNINFAVMDNGICILLSSQNEIELFSSASPVETLQNPPFDSTMMLFTTSDGIFFINGNSFHQIKKK
jgi:hypothetical protein